MGLDPSGPLGGGLLRALINTPTLIERWHFGGIVGYVITAVFVFAIILAAWRFVVLMGMSSKVSCAAAVGYFRHDKPPWAESFKSLLTIRVLTQSRLSSSFMKQC